MHMKKPAFGIVIKVKNLTLCKAFYRDILELGDPVLDSSFRVEFRFGEVFSLFLEKNSWEEPLPPVSGRTAWFYQCGNAAEIRQKMRAYGYPEPCISCADEAGMEFCRFTDPEGNLFYIPVKEKEG